MNRKIFIDCGTHLGMGFSRLISQHGVDDSWEVYGFEANPHVLEGYRNNIKNNEILNRLNITLENRAVWINEDVLSFSLRGIDKNFVDNTPHFAAELDATRKSDLEMMGDGHGLFGDEIYKVPWDGGSCVTDLKKSYSADKPGPLYKWHEDIEVKGLDLSAWILKNFDKNDTIVLKMDIEGSEFKVLPKMLAEGSIDYVDAIYVEWHAWMMGEYGDLENYLKHQVSSRCDMRAWG